MLKELRRKGDGGMKRAMAYAVTMGLAISFAAGSAMAQGSGKSRTLGVCHLVTKIDDSPPPPNEAGAYVFGLDAAAFVYFYDYEQRELRGTTTVKVGQKPAHGVLEDDGGGRYSYYPNAGYLGKDKAVFDVEHAGEKLQVIYFFRTIDGGTDGMEEALCPKKVRFWKISYTVPLPRRTATADFLSL